jgi:hypothetical protein
MAGRIDAMNLAALEAGLARLGVHELEERLELAPLLAPDAPIGTEACHCSCSCDDLPYDPKIDPLLDPRTGRPYGPNL